MTNLEEEAFVLFKRDNQDWIEQYPQWRHVPVNERNRYIQEAKRLAIEDRGMGANEGSVEATLTERGNIYGSYEKVCKTRSYILNVLNQHNPNLTDVQKVAFGDLVLKLVRAAGAPEYKDSFHDLQGYAKLMEDMTDER